MLNKKGSISISINMIVVVVLAFVMLGLMLGLGRNIVTKATDMSDQITEQTRQDIINKLSQSSEPLYFTQREFKIGFNKEMTLMFGVKNVAPSQKSLLVKIEYIDPVSGAKQPLTSKTGYSFGTFQWDVGEQTFRAGEGKPFDVKYFAPSDVGTYQFKFTVTESVTNTFVSEQSIFIMVQ